MVLLSNEQKVKLQKLYQEKKFLELEFEIESISDFKSRSSFLSKLLGVAKLKKKSKTEKDWTSAKELFLDAYNKDRNDIDALCNYANVSIKTRDYDDALKKLIEKKNLGYNFKINEVLARLYSFESKIDKAINLYNEIEKNNDLTQETASYFLASMNYLSNFSQEKYLYLCKKINDNFKIPQEELDKLIEFKLEKDFKIGFISPDLKEHSIFYFLMTVIEELKKDSIKVYAFNIGNIEKTDKISLSIKNQCHQWIDLQNLSDLDSANEIRKNNINILIDISGYFTKNRFMILKYKPAPVQISWMGYVNTMGIKEIDYILADPYLIKFDEEKLYSENILRMPNIWNCHYGINENIDVGPAPFKKNGYLTFGSFNNFSKISDNCIDTWIKILTEIKDCKLFLKGSSKDSDIAKTNIMKIFEENNIEKERTIFADYKDDRREHLKFYRNLDVCLDTFPYPGVTTSFEAIWMGVPVLTKKGNNFVSRCGESINHNLGLEDFIADNENDYISKAIILNKNKEKISNIRISLREKCLNSPLFDKQSFGKSFSSLMKDIWQKYEIKKNQLNIGD